MATGRLFAEHIVALMILWTIAIARVGNHVKRDDKNVRKLEEEREEREIYMNKKLEQRAVMKHLD